MMAATHLHIALSDTGTIRRWSPNPFEGATPYVRADLTDTTLLCMVLADIRAVTGVGMAPGLTELAQAIKERIGQHLRPMADAPRDGSHILAITGTIEDERWGYLSNRSFVISHLGRGKLMDFDLGWSLYPGMGCPDSWFAGWMPLPVALAQEGNANGR